MRYTFTVAEWGSARVYTYEVAETKVTQVMDFARQNQQPAAVHA